jgi:hypothetical protein
MLAIVVLVVVRPRIVVIAVIVIARHIPLVVAVPASAMPVIAPVVVVDLDAKSVRPDINAEAIGLRRRRRSEIRGDEDE